MSSLLCSPLSRSLADRRRILLSLSAFSTATFFSLAAPCALSSVQAQTQAGAISIAIDGKVVPSTSAPILRNGAVFVPLRGPLEALGAKITFDPKTNAITIVQKGQKVVLNPSSTNAIVGTEVVPLSAAPQLIRGSAYVPLRSLAELFGYGVEWSNTTRQVRISTAPKPSADHRATLAQAGNFGVTVDFTDVQPDQVDALLDAVKGSGAKLLKTRFDWQTLQPSKGAAFDWTLYDAVVRGARTRGLTVVGVLGVSATWASRFAGRPTTDATDLLYGPPGDKALPDWSTYVGRVVGRYRDSVQAWQVWENPNPLNFRGPAKLYRVLTKLATDAARRVDANAIVFATDPSGVDLTFINDLARNGTTNSVDGITLYPVSQLQPGAPAPALQFVRSVEAVGAQVLTTGRAKDIWVGGLSRPVVEVASDGSLPGVSTGNAAIRARLQSTFTPQAQADYLVRSSALSLAAGAGKVFFGLLRDPASYVSVDPMDANAGMGLVRRDGTARPAYAALQTLAAQANRPYTGALLSGPDIVALVFDDGNAASVCAWSLNGPRRMIFNLTGTDPKIPGALYVPTRTDTQVLSATGEKLAGFEGEVQLSDSPVWITNVGYEVRNSVKANGAHPFAPVTAGQSYVGAESVAVDFGSASGEKGITWRQFNNLRGVAQEIRKVDGRSGLTTIAQKDITNPNDGKPFIFLDVADDFMFFEKGVPVTVTVEVKRPRVLGGITNSAAAFQIEYSTPTGTKRAAYTIVPPGDDWATFTFDLPDASFSNSNGYDMLIYTGSARQDLTFGSITVKRGSTQATEPTTVPMVVAP